MSTTARKPLRKSTALVSLAALATAALTACSGEDSRDADPDNPVTIGVTVSNSTEPYVIPWLVAMEEGFVEDRGVIVEEIVPSKGGSTTLRNMFSGDLPIADAGLSSVIESAAADAPVTVVGGATQSAYGLDFYALADSGIEDVDDINTWSYTSPGSVTQSLTFMLPEVAGVTHEVERVAAGGVGEGIALLESGDVDATVIPPSISSQNTDKYRLVVSSAEYLTEFQQTLITTTPEYAESHPGVVEAITAGYQEAVDWIGENPEEAGKYYGEYVDIDPALATQVVTDALTFTNWGVGFNAEAISTAIDATKAAGFEGEFDVCATFDPDFLPDGASTDLPEDC